MPRPLPRRELLLALLLASLSTALPHRLGAQQPTVPLIHHDATTLLVPAGRHGLKGLLDATASFLRINIVYDERELCQVGADVELQTGLMLDRESAEDAICQVTYCRRFVLAPRDLAHGIYDLIYLDGPRVRELQTMAQPRTVEQILAHPSRKQPITTVLTLHHVDAAFAINVLRPFFAAAHASPLDLMFGTPGDGRSLLVAGLQSDVAGVMAMVGEIDHASDLAVPGVGSMASAPTVDAVVELARRLQALEQLVAVLQQRLTTTAKTHANGR